jgi:2,3-diketo-5-methylthio-1-phosphopentane phosphatase
LDPTHAQVVRHMTDRSVPKLVVMSDFDGTIVTIDTAEFALRKFADESWMLIDEQFEKGDITFEESIKREFQLLKASEIDILRELDGVTDIRRSFGKLVDYCKMEGLPLIVVSGGLDFCIRHFLQKGECLNSVEIHAPKSTQSKEGFKVTFPKVYDETSINLKDDLVRRYQSRGTKVVYIGNGRADYPAAKIADLAFSIMNSPLAKQCRTDGVPYREFTDFQQVIDAISDYLRQIAASH